MPQAERETKVLSLYSWMGQKTVYEQGSAAGESKGNENEDWIWNSRYFNEINEQRTAESL
jgi:hypothetical protein